jgi:nitric oxide reductase subunit C
MNKRQARLFAIGSTVVAVVAFLGLTIDSHRQFPKLTNAQNITPAVTHGKDVWHKNNCINCHTLFGEGAYYAPDLTKIAQHRGAAYLQAYLKDPSKFYDEQRHRRLMPKQDMTDVEIADLVSFLDWVSKVDNQGWPPRPILVTGAGIGPMGAQPAGQVAAVVGGQPPASVPLPRTRIPSRWARSCSGRRPPRAPPATRWCPASTWPGPRWLAWPHAHSRRSNRPTTRARRRTQPHTCANPSLEPSAHTVAGAMYSASGVSFMPATYGKDLTPDQINHLVAYLATFK